MKIEEERIEAEKKRVLKHHIGLFPLLETKEKDFATGIVNLALNYL